MRSWVAASHGYARLLNASVTLATVAIVGVLWIAVARAGSPVDTVAYLAAGQRLNVGHPLYALSPER